MAAVATAAPQRGGDAVEIAGGEHSAAGATVKGGDQPNQVKKSVADILSSSAAEVANAKTSSISATDTGEQVDVGQVLKASAAIVTAPSTTSAVVSEGSASSSAKTTADILREASKDVSASQGAKPVKDSEATPARMDKAQQRQEATTKSKETNDANPRSGQDVGDILLASAKEVKRNADKSSIRSEGAEGGRTGHSEQEATKSSKVQRNDKAHQKKESSIEEEEEEDDPSTAPRAGPQDILRAALRGDEDAVIKLIKSDPSCVHIVDKHGWSAGHWACNKGHLDVLKRLVNAGMRKTVRDEINRWSLLHVAVISMQKDIIEYLITEGCKEKTDLYGDLPRDCIPSRASVNERLEILDLLNS